MEIEEEQIEILNQQGLAEEQENAQAESDEAQAEFDYEKDFNMSNLIKGTNYLATSDEWNDKLFHVIPCLDFKEFIRIVKKDIKPIPINSREEQIVKMFFEILDKRAGERFNGN